MCCKRRRFAAAQMHLPAHAGKGFCQVWVCVETALRFRGCLTLLRKNQSGTAVVFAASVPTVFCCAQGCFCFLGHFCFKSFKFARKNHFVITLSSFFRAALLYIVNNSLKSGKVCLPDGKRLFHFCCKFLLKSLGYSEQTKKRLCFKLIL